MKECLDIASVFRVWQTALREKANQRKFLNCVMEYVFDRSGVGAGRGWESLLAWPWPGVALAWLGPGMYRRRDNGRSIEKNGFSVLIQN